VQTRLSTLAANAKGASERIARLVLQAEAPSFDNGELTDKGAAASRIVLSRRAALVAALHAPHPAADIFQI
jgi:feruloyl-CoA synthase